MCLIEQAEVSQGLQWLLVLGNSGRVRCMNTERLWSEAHTQSAAIKPESHFYVFPTKARGFIRCVAETTIKQRLLNKLPLYRKIPRYAVQIARTGFGVL